MSFSDLAAAAHAELAAPSLAALLAALSAPPRALGEQGSVVDAKGLPQDPVTANRRLTRALIARDRWGRTPVVLDYFSLTLNSE